MVIVLWEAILSKALMSSYFAYFQEVLYIHKEMLYAYRKISNSQRTALPRTVHGLCEYFMTGLLRGMAEPVDSAPKCPQDLFDNPSNEHNY